jgi:predicted acetyltransferase
MAGFALVTRGSPASEDPEVLDVAEFFVLRAYRRSGVGRRATRLLWNRLPGKWTVRASQGVPSAVKFWREVIAEFTGGSNNESIRPGEHDDWHVFSFEAWPSRD